MARHFLYAMKGSDPAPAGDGDTKSWFAYYKWGNPTVNCVPVSSPYLSAEPGDFIWFVMDGDVLGGARVFSVETPSLPHQKQEIWYRPEDVLEIPPEARVDWGWSYLGWTTAEISEDRGEVFLSSARPKEWS